MRRLVAGPVMEPVGVVGLGLVGSALAGRLAAAGHPVIGFDLRPEARAALRAGEAADSLASLRARVRQVVLAVFDTRDVLAVVDGPDGLLAAGAPAAGSRIRTLVDCSTGNPPVLAALADRLAAREVDFIEAPLSGSSEQIAAGEATMLLGGAPEAIARCAPLLEILSPQRIVVGGAGFGARAKLATNLVLGLNRAVLAEGMAFAEALGIGRATFLELVLATPARSDAARAKGAMMVERAFLPAQSRIRQHLKDVRLMLELAGAAGQPLPLSRAHADLMQAAVAAGDGDLDNAGLLRQWARLAGTDPTPARRD